jgi:uncharacterized protein (DUF952 family)
MRKQQSKARWRSNPVALRESPSLLHQARPGCSVRPRQRRNARRSWQARPLEFTWLRRYALVPAKIANELKTPTGFDRVPRIYKICSASAWREAERSGVYRGSADDLRDGFIHFSTASQVAETARKHFFGQTALFLVEVDADVLGDALRWERSRNDELFPHLYGELDLGAVTFVRDLHARPDGSHDIPELAP